MKLLLIYCKRFAYTPTTKTIDTAPDNSEPVAFRDIQTAFIQLEEGDTDRSPLLCPSL